MYWLQRCTKVDWFKEGICQSRWFSADISLTKWTKVFQTDTPHAWSNNEKVWYTATSKNPLANTSLIYSTWEIELCRSCFMSPILSCTVTEHAHGAIAITRFRTPAQKPHGLFAQGSLHSTKYKSTPRVVFAAHSPRGATLHRSLLKPDSRQAHFTVPQLVSYLCMLSLSWIWTSQPASQPYLQMLNTYHYLASWHDSSSDDVQFYVENPFHCFVYAPLWLACSWSLCLLSDCVQMIFISPQGVCG